MPYRDSLDKIIETYARAMTRKSFSYKEKIIEPLPLTVSPSIFRDYTCPAMCAGCCPTFSLDYLPTDPQFENLPARIIKVNEQEITLYSDLQKDNLSHFCRNVDFKTGRCGIHGRQPFSCDFELLRVIQFNDHHVLMSRLFGRGWAMLRVDGERGARCEMIPLQAKNPE